MAKDAFIQCRVSAETKDALRAHTARIGVSESALLKHLVNQILYAAGPPAAKALLEPPSGPRATRLTIRVAPDDLQSLTARAAAHGMASSTYLAVLLRAHLCALTPLPEAELAAFKRAVAELGALSRSVRELVQRARPGSAIPEHEMLAAFLRIAEALRDHFRAILKSNLESWEKGHVDPQS